MCAAERETDFGYNASHVLVAPLKSQFTFRCVIGQRTYHCHMGNLQIDIGFENLIIHDHFLHTLHVVLYAV